MKTRGSFIKSIVLLGLTVLFSQPLFSQNTQPNFSGEWLLEGKDDEHWNSLFAGYLKKRGKSASQVKFSTILSVVHEGSRIVIDSKTTAEIQHGGGLIVEKHTVRHERKTIVADGSVKKTTRPDGGRTKRKVVWKGEKLWETEELSLFVSFHEKSPTHTLQTWETTYFLSPDGEELTIILERKVHVTGRIFAREKPFRDIYRRVK
ncbi:MAG TPA: hypothetical protein VFZ23_16870 [Pyrinomonadaceae bacterium]